MVDKMRNAERVLLLTKFTLSLLNAVMAAHCRPMTNDDETIQL